jgi:hypothetical protein
MDIFSFANKSSDEAGLLVHYTYLVVFSLTSLPCVCVWYGLMVLEVIWSVLLTKGSWWIGNPEGVLGIVRDLVWNY